MRVLVDAYLPIRLSELLSAHDNESRHTLDLPKKNATPDPEIIRFADDENRIVISKDSDFLDNYILHGSPKKLLIVSKGNINNQNLIRLFEKNLDTLKSLFEENSVIEINEEDIQLHS